LHLQRRVVPSDDARAALAVLRANYLPEDPLIEGMTGDSTNKQDREAVLGHFHLVLTLLHRSVDAKYYVGVVVGSVGVVLGSVGVVMGREGVFCIDGEGACGGYGGGGRRLRSGSGDILLGGLCWKRLHLGRHGGVVVFVVDSFIGGGVVGVVVSVVVTAVVVVGVIIGFDVIVGVDVGVGAFARENGTILSKGNYPKEEEGEPR
jgi:hypothetical protein